MTRWIFCVLASAMMIGCTTTRPPERYPNLAAVSKDSLCLVREGDHCFIGSIDGQFIDQYDVNILNWGTYRQYRLPAGHHVLAVYYRQAWNYDVISGGPRHIAIDVLPGKDYELKSHTNGIDVIFGDALRTVNWRPEVVDCSSGHSVGEAPVDDVE